MATILHGHLHNLLAGIPQRDQKVFEVHRLTEEETALLTSSLETGNFIRVFPAVEIMRIVDCRHLTAIPPNTRFPVYLRDLHITGARIQELPDLSYLPDLEIADFRDNHIVSLKPDATFHANVRTIDLSYNKIRVIPDYAVFPGESIVDLSFNYLTVPSPDPLRFSTHHNEIPPRDEVRSVLYALDGTTGQWISPRTGSTLYVPFAEPFAEYPFAEYRIAANNQRPTVPKTNFYQGSQNVHGTTVQNSSLDAIQTIMTMAKTLRTLKGMALVNAVNTIFYKKILFIFPWPKKYSRIPNLHEWVVECTSVHSRLNVTFEGLLGAAWAVIEAHPFRETLRERLAEELHDAMGLCFTGRMTRVVNAMHGLVDGIRVSVSPRERLQAAAIQIVGRKASTSTKDVAALQQELISVIDDVPDITQGERDAWIEAFNDA